MLVLEKERRSFADSEFLQRERLLQAFGQAIGGTRMRAHQFIVQLVEGSACIHRFGYCISRTQAKLQAHTLRFSHIFGHVAQLVT